MRPLPALFRRGGPLRLWAVAIFAVALMAVAVSAQLPAPDDGARATRRLDERIRALRDEAETLAASSRTLLDELRALEVERGLRAAEAERAAAELVAAEAAIQEAAARLMRLESERDQQIPALHAQLADLYKRGSGTYAAILFGANNIREAGRAIRVAAALVEVNHRRLEQHQLTLERLATERATLEEQRVALEARQRAAQTTRAAAERAVKAHAARLAEIDARRDLTAQYVGELQVARERLQQALEERSTGSTRVEAVPLRPFQGALGWPADGTLAGRFGQSANRLGGSAVRNGIEIAAPLDTAVRAVHEGTVAHAGPFSGYGTLVILDHGADHFSLYGYLASVSVMAGDRVRSGAEVGRVGNAPAGPSALYFELRIDGRAVDPVQWLEPR